jgi:hypothetical protein
VRAAHGARRGASAIGPDLKAFCVRTPEGALRVCLINKNSTRDARIMIEAQRSFAIASIMRLTGPGIDATEGIVLGGASVDELGGWAPEPREAAYLNSQESTVDVPAASAAVVFLSD